MGATTIFIPKQSLPSKELNQGGTSTAATLFTGYLISKDNPFPGTAETITIIPQPNKLVNKSFRIRAWGRVTGGTTTNYTATLLYDTTIIEASTARAVNSASHNWFIEAIGVWDSTSNKFQGFGRSMVGNLFDAEAALDNVVSPDFTTNNTVGFNVKGTFSSGNAANVAYLDGFECEVL